MTVTLNPAIDTTFAVERVRPDRKLRGTRPRQEPGGGGLNIARVAQRFGADALALWSQGGLRGDRLADLLDQEGIRHRPVPVDGETRENFVVGERDSDQQYRFCLPGPELTQADRERWLDAVAGLEPRPDHLAISGSLPGDVDPGFLGELIRRMPETTRVIVDTSGEALRRAVEQQVFLIKPNLRELSELLGEDLRDDGGIARAARSLVRDGRVAAVLVSLGGGGSLLVTADQQQHVRSPTVPVRSRVGAGDSLVGGLLAGLARGEPLLQAVRRGVAAGAATVQTPGTALCSREDAERLLAELGSDG